MRTRAELMGGGPQAYVVAEAINPVIHRCVLGWLRRRDMSKAEFKRTLTQMLIGLLTSLESLGWTPDTRLPSADDTT